AKNRKTIAAQLLATDPDGFGFDCDRDGERFIYFTTGLDPNRENDNPKAPQYLADEYTSNKDPITKKYISQPSNPNLYVRVPPLPYRLDASTGSLPIPLGHRYFIGRT